MDESIQKLLAEGALPAELVASLQEAFDKKVSEARSGAEATVREEFAARYEHDKANLVEAMDRMLNDVVRKHADEQQAETKRFVEARNTFRRAVKEARAKSAKALNENLAVSRKLVTERVAKEVQSLREQKKALTEARLAVADSLNETKQQLISEQARRISKIDEFIVRNVTKELKEFAEDHQALIKTRAKLVTEGRQKLAETQAKFVREAAKTVEKVVNESLSREMRQLHNDLEANRQNMFGRRIFEAVAAEYMSSYLAEGTEVRKLQNEVAASEAKINEANSKLEQALKESQAAARKARLAEDRASRNKVMGELLSNLRGDKRAVMEGMLETVRTDALRGTFNKLLPVVLDETTRKVATKRPLSETALRAPSASVVTGNNRSATRLFESNEDPTQNDDAELAQVVRLAGISK